MDEPKQRAKPWSLTIDGQPAGTFFSLGDGLRAAARHSCASWCALVNIQTGQTWLRRRGRWAIRTPRPRHPPANKG